MVASLWGMQSTDSLMLDKAGKYSFSRRMQIANQHLVHQELFVTNFGPILRPISKGSDDVKRHN